MPRYWPLILNLKTFFRRSMPVAFLALTISCADDEKAEDLEISPYSWKESSLSPNGLFTNAQFEIADDGNLYAYGKSENGVNGFYRLPGPTSNTWTKVGEPVVNEFHTFAVYQGSVYYAFDKLYKLEGEETKEILNNGGIGDMEVCQGKLVFIGGSIDILNDRYAIASYDGTTFEPVSKDWTTHRGMIPANNKIYIAGYPSGVYDGKSITQLNFDGYFSAIDAEELIYYSETYNNRLSLYRTPNFGKREALGNPITGMADIFRSVEFFDGDIFVIGVDIYRGYSKVYFLKEDKWIEVPTEHVISDVIIYDNKLIASSTNGKIYELLKD